MGLLLPCGRCDKEDRGDGGVERGDKRRGEEKMHSDKKELLLKEIVELKIVIAQMAEEIRMAG